MFPNPYDSFMRNHLSHYGYYTGKNANYRSSYNSFENWERTHGYGIVGESSSEGDDDSDPRKFAENGYDPSYRKSRDQLQRTTQLVFDHMTGKVRLRDPRPLYGFSTEQLNNLQLPRWPSDMQVLEERVKHIQTLPEAPEPFYKSSGMEKTPLVKSIEATQSRLVYEYQPLVGNFEKLIQSHMLYIKSRVGGSRNGCQVASVRLQNEADETLIFESRFESGNLGKAVQVGEHEYELFLRYDLYTAKHTQWFYFRVDNTRANTTYRFTIVNFMKPDSLYNQGMRPLMYSERMAQEEKIGWMRCGSDIKYYRNNINEDTCTESADMALYTMGKADRWYYSLTWTVTFKHDRDSVYFAHCYPYTYSDLQDYLNDIQNDPVKSKFCRQRLLCRTLASNCVHLLTITSPFKNAEEAKHRKAVVLTARVHPGETNASWMMKGFLDYLTGDSADAKLLRDTFVFKIIPMLNPDGVIVGNYRCSLAGRDLNRNYKSLLKDSFPAVWHTKHMIKKLQEERDVVVYCDLHGHSRKQNVFIYGCENRGNPQRRLRERIFPVMLSRNAPDKFSFECCKFKVQKSKEGTGRIVMWNLGIMNSFTMEATFAGSTRGKMKGQHFSTADFESLGYHFCDSLLDYCDPDNSKCAKILLELQDRLKAEIIAKLKLKEGEAVTEENIESFEAICNKAEQTMTTVDSEGGASSDDGGSDSSVSDGLPAHLEYMKDKLSSKKKSLKSRKDRDSKHKCKTKAIRYQQGQRTRPKSKESKASMVERPCDAAPVEPTEVQQTRKQEARRREATMEGQNDKTGAGTVDTKALNGAGEHGDRPYMPHFRYTASNDSGAPVNANGGEPNFAANFVARHLRQHREHLQQCDFPAAKTEESGTEATASQESSQDEDATENDETESQESQDFLEDVVTVRESSASARTDVTSPERPLINIAPALSLLRDVLSPKPAPKPEPKKEAPKTGRQRSLQIQISSPSQHMSFSNQISWSHEESYGIKNFAKTKRAAAPKPSVEGRRLRPQSRTNRTDSERPTRRVLLSPRKTVIQEQLAAVWSSSSLRSPPTQQLLLRRTASAAQEKRVTAFRLPSFSPVPRGSRSTNDLCERPFSGMTGSVLSRRETLQPRHIVEVSAAQQRHLTTGDQNDLTQKLSRIHLADAPQDFTHNEDVQTPIRPHPRPFDEPHRPASKRDLQKQQRASGRSRRSQANNHNRSANSSNAARRESLASAATSSSTTATQEARAGASGELSSTMKSINEIKEQLKAKRSKLSPTTDQFVEHIVRKTDAEISDITEELQQQLERQQLQQQQDQRHLHRQQVSGKPPRKTSAPLREADLKTSPRKARHQPVNTPRSEPAPNNDSGVTSSGPVAPGLRTRELSQLGSSNPATNSGIDFVTPSPGRTAGQAPNTGRLRHADPAASTAHFRYGAEFVGELEGFQMSSSSTHLLDGVGGGGVLEQRSRPPPTRSKAPKAALKSASTQSEHPLYDVAAPLPARKPHTGAHSRTQSSNIGTRSEQQVAIEEPEVLASARTEVVDAPMYTSQDIDDRVKKSSATLNLYEVSQRLQTAQPTSLPTKSAASGKRGQQDAFQPLPSNKSAGKRRTLQVHSRSQKEIESSQDTQYCMGATAGSSQADLKLQSGPTKISLMISRPQRSNSFVNEPQPTSAAYSRSTNLQRSGFKRR